MCSALYGHLQPYSLEHAYCPAFGAAVIRAQLYAALPSASKRVSASMRLIHTALASSSGQQSLVGGVAPGGLGHAQLPCRPTDALQGEVQVVSGQCCCDLDPQPGFAHRHDGIAYGRQEDSFL
jgi:hypothetical protein